MSKKISFTKMVGAGNDFLVVHPTPKNVNLTALTTHACNRADGVGADGILLLEPSKKADYKMRIINSDGSEAEMCGNGARCMAAYIVRNKKPRKKLFTLETLAGILHAEAKDEIAKVELSAPKDYRPDITIRVEDRPLLVHYIDTGVPHTIIFVDDVESIDVETIGPKIRYHDAFKPRGTNVNFVEQINDNLIKVRTYERGVEGETKACGTGSVACAIISYLKIHPDVTSKNDAQMDVITRSGETLKVIFNIDNNHSLNNVRLKGSARFIAQGEFYLK